MILWLVFKAIGNSEKGLLGGLALLAAQRYIARSAGDQLL
tara:strand:+ start:2396 stop:2515 length:120 start_codon:yes stop_codon:yes gene_type:complete